MQGISFNQNKLCNVIIDNGYERGVVTNPIERMTFLLA